jgi:serine/threonine-protein kinase
MAEDPTEPHWWQTLPAILTGIAAVIGAITALLGVLGQLPWQHPKPEASTITTTSPTTTPPVPTPVGPPPIPGTDAQGFLPPSSARCDVGHHAAAMGVTTHSVLVVCQTGPGAFYYRAVRFSDGAPADLNNAVRDSVGFDVQNPLDKTRYEIRPDQLTIRMADGRVAGQNPMTAYWPR